MNKLKHNPRYISYKIISNFLSSKEKLSQLINHFLEINNTSSKEKPFITEICYGVIRYYYLLEYLITLYPKNNTKINKNIFSLLLIGVYQLKFMDSVPDYASINTTVELCKSISMKDSKFVNAILRKISKTNHNKLIDSHYIKEAFPKWLYDLYKTDFGSETTNELMKSQNLRPTHWIRINKDYSKTISLLLNNNVTFEKYTHNNNYLNVTSINHPIIKILLTNGHIYVQSPSSGHVVDLLNLKKNDSILDACASPGGKFSDIYFKCKKNKILSAYDITKERFIKLETNIATMNIKDVELFNEDFLKCDNHCFNKILLDVPCSGTGSINKKPDIKIRRNLNQYKQFNKNQYSLLNHAAEIIPSKGTLVYSTCSLNNVENWQIVDSFLQKNKNFKIDKINNLVPEIYIDKKGALFICPHIHKLDGIFAVKLKRL